LEFLALYEWNPQAAIAALDISPSRGVISSRDLLNMTQSRRRTAEPGTHRIPEDRSSISLPRSAMLAADELVTEIKAVIAVDPIKGRRQHSLRWLSDPRSVVHVQRQICYKAVTSG
jgi:hypothetical protein